MSSMEKVGNSSLWEYRYRPTTVKDLILPEKEKKYFLDMVASGEVDNMLLFGTAGRGKTSVAIALCQDVDAEYLYINASKDNKIEVVRGDIEKFATSCSLDQRRKVVILDEAECLTDNTANGAGAQNALKSVIETVEKNCRFIFTTNNMSRINDALKSRCGRTIDFNFTKEDSVNLMRAYFKRLCWILDTEKVTYDKKTLAEFVQTNYPDFRKTLNRLQMLSKMYGCVDERILSAVDNTKVLNLIDEMKNKKWNNARKIVSEMDFTTFYGELYQNIEPYLKDDSKPSCVLTIGEWQWKAAMSNDKELPCVCCVTDLMKEAVWK